MARKVFISFLGLTDYSETVYKWEDEEVESKSKPTRFVQEAILNKIAQEWNENDRIYIFYTSKSYEFNWIDGGYKDKNGQDKLGLKTTIQNLYLQAQLNEREKDFFIEDGYTENQIWKIFQTVYNKLEKDDLIYFDMTHTFRSIPIFASILFNFAQYIKNTKVMTVLYGALDNELKVGRIVDMTNIVKLQSLIETATSITKFGRAPKSISDNLKELVGKKDINTINSIIKGVTDLDEFIQSNRINEIENGSYLKKLNEAKKPLKKATTIETPVTEIINKISNIIEDYNFKLDCPDSNIIAAINWSNTYNMLPQAYTLAREFVLFFLAKKFSYLNPFNDSDEEDNNKDFREFISKTLQIKKDKIINNELYDELLKYPYNFFKLLNESIICELREYDAYPKLAEYRNIINHAKKGTYKDIKNTFDKSFKKCLDIIHKYINN